MSVPGSGCLLSTDSAMGGRPVCHPRGVLRTLRDESGKPSGAIRALALVVALLLALPLTLFVTGLLRSLGRMLF